MGWDGMGWDGQGRSDEWGRGKGWRIGVRRTKCAPSQRDGRGQGRAGQGSAGQGRAGQGRAGPEGDEQVVVACYGAKSVALASMYAGALTARWELRATAGAASARGHARACLHTFEEGNVRLDVERSWRAQLDEVDGVDALAGALVTLVRRSEGEWHEELLDGFADLGGHAIKARRAAGCSGAGRTGAEGRGAQPVGRAVRKPGLSLLLS